MVQIGLQESQLVAEKLLEIGSMEHKTDWLPTVFRGTNVSDEVHIGWNYQPKDTQDFEPKIGSMFYPYFRLVEILVQVKP